MPPFRRCRCLASPISPDTQEGVLNIAFKFDDDNGLLARSQDFRSLLVEVERTQRAFHRQRVRPQPSGAV